MKTPDFFGLLFRLVHGGRSDADAALDEASRLRASCPGAAVTLDGRAVHSSTCCLHAKAQAEAALLYEKELRNHRAWLRENAASVTVPEHPAVALLREIERGHPWSKSCPECAAVTPSDPLEDMPHATDCRLAAILAGSKLGDRALSDLLAEERAKGAAEERARHEEAIRIAKANAYDNGHREGAAEEREAWEAAVSAALGPSALRDAQEAIRARGQR